MDSWKILICSRLQWTCLGLNSKTLCYKRHDGNWLTFTVLIICRSLLCGWWLSPSPRSRHRLCCRTATSTIYTTFHYIHYVSQRSNAKNCFKITGLQCQDSKQSADNNTRYSPSKPITECIKFTKRAELWTDFWQLDDVFEPPGRNELVVWKTDSLFFFSHLTRPTGVWGSSASRA